LDFDLSFLTPLVKHSRRKFRSIIRPDGDRFPGLKDHHKLVDKYFDTPLDHWLHKIPLDEHLVTIYFGILVGILVAVFLIPIVRKCLKDKATLASVEYLKTMDWDLTGRQLMDFNYKRFRIRRLYNLNKVNHVVSNWPDIRPPHFKDELSNRLLYELEAKWNAATDEEEWG
jgi:hypothetical protein